MSSLSLQMGLPSKFEELVLTSIREIGHGATFFQIFHKAEELGQMKGEIKFVDLHRTLYLLDYFRFVHSWSDEPEYGGRWRHPEKRHFRVQLQGERLLEAVSERRKDSEQSNGSHHPLNMMTVVWNWLSGGRKP